MFTKAKMIDAAKVGAIVVAGVALAEAFGIMAKVRAFAGKIAPNGAASRPAGEATPQPYILPGF